MQMQGYGPISHSSGYISLLHVKCTRDCDTEFDNALQVCAAANLASDVSEKFVVE